ncbi:unnamed protein product [Thelazia callipaeda]|uniref:Protein kinase domain-containing protein n=1 Tax=Thelazia callipaeda TaxID=103827 RepID=A0A0N5D0Q8_THECL|nr:unnamed protein product [Thelazia callipaeda]
MSLKEMLKEYSTVKYEILKFRHEDEEFIKNCEIPYDAIENLKAVLDEIGLELHPIANEEKDYDDYYLELKEENYFGRISELFIKERLLKKPGDFLISLTHEDAIRFSIMSESCEICHSQIVINDGRYSFENCIYPKASSVARLIQKCFRSPMNVLSAVFSTSIVMRHLVDPNTENKDEYSLRDLFLTPDDRISKEKLISKGKHFDVLYFGKLSVLGELEQVMIRVLYQYDANELDNIFRELHISNLLGEFIPVDCVLSVKSVQLYQFPYSIIYPYMNCGSYPEFVQQMGSRLTFVKFKELIPFPVSFTIARALADMHFLGFLHCDIAARNIFVQKLAANQFQNTKHPFHTNYKYYLGDFRHAHIGKVKEVDPQRPINIRWLAPEVFRTNHLNEATDVYAWGITLYEIFTGNLPYFSMTAEEVRSYLCGSHRIRPEIRNTNLPKNILNLMQRCWRTDVHERPSMDGVWLRLKAIREHLYDHES